MLLLAARSGAWSQTVPVADGFQSPYTGNPRQMCEFGRFGECLTPGEYHLAEDYALSVRSPVYACADGIVRMAESGHSYGSIVLIEHLLSSGEHVVSLYAHLCAPALEVKTTAPFNQVRRGDVIGYVADREHNGGYDPHFHFGIHRDSYDHANHMPCDGGWAWEGYSPNDCVLSDWWDPSDFIRDHPAANTHYEAANPVGQFSDGWHNDGISQAFLSKYQALQSANPSHNLGFPWNNGPGGRFVHEQNGMYMQDFSGCNNNFTLPYSALIRKVGDWNVCLLKEGFWDHWINHHGWINFGAPVTDEDPNAPDHAQMFYQNGLTSIFRWVNGSVHVEYQNGIPLLMNNVTFVGPSLLSDEDGVYCSGVPVTGFGTPVELVNGSIYSGFYAVINGAQVTIPTFTVTGDMTIDVGAPAPQADFSANPTSGSLPLNVQFTDLSTGSPISWEWYFGDGSSSMAQNPSHTYTVAGYYTVTLVAHNVAGWDQEQKEHLIAVNQPGVHVTGPTMSQVGACGGLAVQWTTTGYMESMRIELNRSYPEGQWETLAYNAPNNGFFAWLVTGPPTQRARFKVTSNYDPTIWDVSDADLTIIAPAVISPNGGEVLVARNGTYHVTWDPAWESSTPVRIELNRSYPDGQWEPIELQTPNDGETWWYVTGPATSHARIRIIGGEGSCINDWSDSDFTILAPELELTSPAPGDTVMAAIPYDVAWTTHNLPGDVRITLNYFSNFGGGGTQVLQECTPNDGSEPCIIRIPWGYEIPLTASASIEIRSLYYPGIYTVSDSDFYFTTPAISIEQPWTNTVWNAGQVHSVTWSSWYADCPVMIELNRSYPGGPWEVLTPAAPNTGNFAWVVTPPVSNHARVRISTTSYPLLTDTTDGDFTITDIQPPGVLWTRTFGSSNYDAAQSADETADNGYVVAGRSTLPGNSDEDMWLIRLNSAGDTLWSRRYNGPPYSEAAFAVQQTTDGGFILIGYWGGSRPYFVKTNAAGDMMWNRVMRGPCGVAWAGIQTDDGGYLGAGQSQSGDAELVRVSAAGDSLWSRFYGGGGMDVANAVLQTIGGDYVFAGTTGSFGAGAEDMYVVKTSGAGDVLWTRTYGGASYDRAYGITETHDGGYVIVGETFSFGDMWKMFVVRTNSDGDTLWMRSYPPPMFRRGNSVKQLFDGSFLVGGNGLNGDMILAKLDQNGDTLWVRTYGGPSDEGLNAVLQTRDGDFLLTGYTQSYGAGYYDYYVLKIAADSPCSDWTPASPPITATIAGDGLTLHWDPVVRSIGDCPEVIQQYEVLGSSSIDGPYLLLGRVPGTQTGFAESLQAVPENLRFYRVKAVVSGSH